MTDKKKDVGDVSLARNEHEALHAFQSLMWEKLKANAHKGGWQESSLPDLTRRLGDEVVELGAELIGYAEATDSVRLSMRAAIARECADVANFAMFIADVVGGLPYTRSGE